MSSRTDWRWSAPPWAAEWMRPPTPRVPVRASSAERSAVQDDLLRHYADGRLDEEEYDRRMARAAGARTVDELDALLVDLPSDATALRTTGAHHDERHRRGRHGHRGPLPLVVVVLLVWVAVSTVATIVTATAHLAVSWVLVVAAVALILHRRHH